MKDFYGILGAGAFGGALSWIFSITVGKPLPLSKAEAIFASVLLGAGASVIGVYIVANTDRKDVGRALAFAILCGFSWQVVYEAGGATLQRHDARETVDKSAKNLAGAAQDLNAATPQEKTEVVETIVGNTTALLEASESADSKEADQKAVEVSMSALDALKTAGPGVSPEATSTAAETIATAALEAGHYQVAAKAIETLADGGVTTQDNVALDKIIAVAEEKNDVETVRLARSAKIRQHLVKPETMQPLPMAPPNQ